MLDSSGQVSFLHIQYQNQRLQVRYADQGQGDPILFLHGWACSNQVFDSLRQNLSDLGRHIAIDFPGFGESTLPASAWGTEEYAEWLHLFLQELRIPCCTVVGHSFGGRVALRLAKRWPEQVESMILIASAGLKRQVPWPRRWRVKLIRTLARTAENCLPSSLGKPLKDSLFGRIASRDYQNAGALKPIFVKVVNEDLSGILPDIHRPALLLYGSEDCETTPAQGRRLAELLPNGTFIELPGFDHLSVLDRGRHQVETQIRRFLKGLSSCQTRSNTP